MMAPQHIEMPGSPRPVSVAQITDNAALAPFYSLGEQLHAIVRACSYPGKDPEPRLIELNRRGTAAGSSEAVPSEGGFLLAPEFSRTLVKRMYLTGDILARCTEMPMSTSNAIKFPQFSETSRVAGSRLGGVQAMWENEAAALVGTKPGFALNEMVAKKITALIYVTDELAMDSDALNSWANYAFSLESTFKLEAGIVNGTGAGMPLGVMNAPALVSVAKESGQASATVVNANVQKMLSAFWAAGRRNAVWLYNQALLQQLSGLTTIVGIAGSQSNSWQYALDDTNTDRLCGIPAFPSEYCQVPGTPGDLILADFSRYMVGFRERRTDVSIHVKYLTDERVFRLVVRVDGQPIDQAAVTPEHGTTATSPFVALAAR